AWGAPVLVQDDTACNLFNDKNWIAVDTFPGSPHTGRVYSAWDRSDSAMGTQPQLLRYSDDRGATWSALVTVSPSIPLLNTIGAFPLVQPNGDLTIVYDTIFPPPNRVVSQTSHDGGNIFDAPVTVDTYEGHPVPGMRTANDAILVVPGAAVDPGTGKLYAVWADGRCRSDGENDIVLSVSADGGASWGPLAVASETAPAHPVNHFTPAVAAIGSTVLVAYGTRADGDQKVFMRYVTS